MDRVGANCITLNEYQPPLQEKVMGRRQDSALAGFHMAQRAMLGFEVKDGA
jgi:hypothetical protein